MTRNLVECNIREFYWDVKLAKKLHMPKLWFLEWKCFKKYVCVFINNENLPEGLCHQSVIYLVIFPHNLKVLSTIIKASSSPRPSLKLIPASHKSKQNKLELNFSMLLYFQQSFLGEWKTDKSYCILCLCIYQRKCVFRKKKTNDCSSNPNIRDHNMLDKCS